MAKNNPKYSFFSAADSSCLGCYLTPTAPPIKFNAMVCGDDTTFIAFTAKSSAQPTTFAIKNNATLWAWGSNRCGKLGDGTTVDKCTPVPIGNGQKVWKSITRGNQDNIYGIKTNGTLWAWGYNTGLNGILGLNNTITDYSSPTQIGTGTDWCYVYAGDAAVVAIKCNGTLWGWGCACFSTATELPITSVSGTPIIISPVQIGANTNWSKVVIGPSNSVAIKTDGTLWAWGACREMPIASCSLSSPVQVGTDTNWRNIFTTKDNGSFRNNQTGYAIKNDGTLWAWGCGAKGALGTNSTIDRSSPTQVGTDTNWCYIQQVESNTTGTSQTVFGTKSDGTLWAWGGSCENAFGQGCYTTGTYYSSPVQIGTNSDNWFKVSPGGLAALSLGGVPYFWDCSTAYGSFGIPCSSVVTCACYMNYGDEFVNRDKFLSGGIYRAGLDCTITPDKTSLGYSSPVQYQWGNQWKCIDANEGSIFGIKTDGTLWASGGNSWGMLGRNSGCAVGYSSPIQFAGSGIWKEVSVGSSIHAIKNNGQLWASGGNFCGQIGIGTTSGTGISPQGISSPVQVGTEQNWFKVSSGYFTTIAIKCDGTLWSWGDGTCGSLGSNAVAKRSSPVQVGTGTTWCAVTTRSPTTAYDFSIAIKCDGTLWSWGRNSNGYLGDGTTIHKSSPTQIGTATTWNSVSAGSSFVLATKTDGTLWAWGQGTVGQLGNNNTIDVSSPVQIGRSTEWKCIKAGLDAAVGVKTDGTLWTWGCNSNGSLGLGDCINRSSPTQVGSQTIWHSGVITSNDAYGYVAYGSISKFLSYDNNN